MYKEEKENSKFVDAESNNWKEREGNKQHGMDGRGGMLNKNETLATERCENIDTLYINIKYYSIRKGSELILFCENVVDFNEERLHETTLILHKHT